MKLNLVCMDIFNRAPSPPSWMSVLCPSAPGGDVAVLSPLALQNCFLGALQLSSSAVGFGWHSCQRLHPRPPVLLQ